jgi:metal-sulfur cluster biosynthetic enzyme
VRSGNAEGLEAAVREALATVEEPELHRSLTDLGMVQGVARV